METIYDWLTVTIFAVIAVLFLQRSTKDQPGDTLWHYLPPAIGCGVANQFGNNGYTVVAAILMVAVLAYLIYILKLLPPRDS